MRANKAAPSLAGANASPPGRICAAERHLAAVGPGPRKIEFEEFCGDTEVLPPALGALLVRRDPRDRPDKTCRETPRPNGAGMDGGHGARDSRIRSRIDFKEESFLPNFLDFGFEPLLAGDNFAGGRSDSSFMVSLIIWHISSDR